MDIRKVKKLIELLEESGVAEIEIKEGEETVRISRHAPAGVHGFAAPMAYPPPFAAPPPPQAAAGAPSVAAPAAPPPHSPEKVVTAPMVGTFYAASEPGGKPYVTPGSRISKGQVLCIIEAMKIMNEIESEFSGVIKEVLVEDAHPVEYGQVLFHVDPHE